MVLPIDQAERSSSSQQQQQTKQQHKAQSGLSFAREMWRFPPSHQRKREQEQTREVSDCIAP